MLVRKYAFAGLALPRNFGSWLIAEAFNTGSKDHVAFGKSILQIMQRYRVQPNEEALALLEHTLKNKTCSS